jgi:fumarylacetoacetate (FAA) hydrolase
MKLVSYIKEGHEQLALLVDDTLYDADALNPELPSTMSMFLNYWEDYLPLAKAINDSIIEGKVSINKGFPIESATLLSPVPQPSSCRVGYAFSAYAKAFMRNYMTELSAAFEQFPAFYFSNHHSLMGPGIVPCMPDHLEKLDFELQVAVVISRQGRNIPAAEADEYIGGFMIMNGFTARQLQKEEIALSLGQAKGNDFARVTGPWLVTTDELETSMVEPKPGHTGNSYNLPMRCWVNGVLVSEGNMQDMDWTFAELIERCSYGTDIFPGDVISSGPVGTGCFLEANSLGAFDAPEYEEQWLKVGDTVTMEIESLGTLTSTIAEDESTLSLLALKKEARNF